MRNKENIITLAVSIVATLLCCVVAMCINVYCGIICVVLGITINAVYIQLTVKRYKQITALNDYLSAVCTGDYSLDISDNTEGELSILKNNLYKVVVQLQSSNEALTNDKLYLADSLADISHQLKTPLTSMMVMTDLIKDEQNKDKQLEFVQIIENQLSKMKWLIATLLKLSKLDAGTANMQKAQVSINNVVEESIKPFLISLDLKNIELVSNIEDFSFIGDINWSVEAVQNIIKNCIEHTADNGKIEITAKQANVYNELVIKDNGTGIHKDDLPHIFERFYHGKNSSSDSVGIGLALSKEILQKQNAQIEVISENGTEFRIKFYKTIV